MITTNIHNATGIKVKGPYKISGLDSYIHKVTFHFHNGYQSGEKQEMEITVLSKEKNILQLPEVKAPATAEDAAAGRASAESEDDHDCRDDCQPRQDDRMANVI